MTVTAVQSGPIQPARILEGLPSTQDGACLLFLGVVRDHNEGRPVSGLEYEVYQGMAEKTLTAIAAEASHRFGTDRVHVVHRVGELGVGEISTAIAVATPHREEAYGASRYIIEEIKQRLPIWKRERYLDGDSSWVGADRFPASGGVHGDRMPDEVGSGGGKPREGREGDQAG
jgi:molybdopterin synthase catalytic subunit